MEKLIAFNIGYSGLGSGILSPYPTIWECDFPTFAKKQRQKGTIKQLFKWAKANHVPPSSIVLHITIWYEDEYWQYTIKMINVREYRAHWEKVYGKTWQKWETLQYNINMKNKITGRDVLIIVVMGAWAAGVIWGILHSI